MKLTLSFNTETEYHDAQCAMHGAELRCVLQDIDNHLRNKLKHGKISEEAYNELVLVRELLYDSMPNGVPLWE